MLHVPVHDLPAALDRLLYLLRLRLRFVFYGYINAVIEGPLEKTSNQLRDFICVWQLHSYRGDGLSDRATKAVQEDVLQNQKICLHLLAIDARGHVRARIVGRRRGLGFISVVYSGLRRDLVLSVLHPVRAAHDHQAVPGDMFRAMPAGLRPRD